MAPPEYGSIPTEHFHDEEALSKLAKAQSIAATETTSANSDNVCADDCCDKEEKPSNLKVLSVAFLTFVGFMGFVSARACCGGMNLLDFAISLRLFSNKHAGNSKLSLPLSLRTASPCWPTAKP